MKNTLVVFLLILIVSGPSIKVHAQNKPVDNSTYKYWQALKDLPEHKVGVLSPHGNYFSYVFGSNEYGDSVAVESVDGYFKVKEKLGSAYSIQFSSDERFVFFKYDIDSLIAYDLKLHSLAFTLGNVEKIQLIESTPEPLLIINHTSGKGIGIYSLVGKMHKLYPNFWRYSISSDSRWLVLSSGVSIVGLSLSDMRETQIHAENEIAALKVDEKSKSVCWFSMEKNGGFTCWKFERKTSNKSKIFDFKRSQIQSRSKPIQVAFLKDFKGIVFQVSEQEVRVDRPENVVVWSYKDFFVTNYQREKTSTYYYDTGKGSLSFLFNESQDICGSLFKMVENDCVITQTKINLDGSDFGKVRSKAIVYHLLTGKKQEVIDQFTVNQPVYFSYSPCAKYLTWWSNGKKEYFCYNLAKGKTVSLTGRINSEFFEGSNEMPGRRHPYGIGKWESNDQYVYLYDQFDIWRLDPEGIRPPKNVTLSEGKKLNIKIRFADGKPVVNSNEQVVLSLFNIVNKQNGLMPWRIKDKLVILKSYLGDYCYRDNKTVTAARYKILEYSPVSASHSSNFLVRRESATESGNLFLTSDFLTYSQLTTIAPQKGYKWYKNKLIEWKQTSNKIGKGILYYPEDLDSNKKYPLVIHYYEKKSDELNIFKDPHLSDGEIDIAWYVSNGYAVFLPDMHYETGNLKTSIKQTVSCAIKELGLIPWIDISNMGIQGHSFGGFETFSLITSLNFKAAQASSGISEWISYHPHIFMDGTRESFIESDQGNMGDTPWAAPEVYLKNSPALFIDSVNTPVLIMHGKQDYNVPIAQSYQMYVGLRRLNKPVWLISYNDEDHNLINEANQLDFSIRQQEFFGYFLKGEKKPEWLR